MSRDQNRVVVADTGSRAASDPAAFVRVLDTGMKGRVEYGMIPAAFVSRWHCRGQAGGTLGEQGRSCTCSQGELLTSARRFDRHSPSPCPKRRAQWHPHFASKDSQPQRQGRLCPLDSMMIEWLLCHPRGKSAQTAGPRGCSKVTQPFVSGVVASHGYFQDE